MQITAKINGQLVAETKATTGEIAHRRNGIMAVARHLLASDIPQVDCPVTHRFADGIYIREILMPADTFVIGKIHATNHFNEVISGECRVITPASNKAETHKAGDIFVSEAGVQKVVYCLTDVVWRTVHLNPTNTQDLDVIESFVIADNYECLPHDELIENCKRILI